MKKSAVLMTKSALAALLLASGFLACNKSEDNTTNPTGPTLSAPTNLQAYSASVTSVGLQWTLSASESDAAFDHYSLKVKDNTGAVVTTQTLSKGNSQTVVTGLTEGVVYTFVLRSADSGVYLSPDSASVQWSPAKRLTTDNQGGPPIQVYEFASSAGASGLQFYSQSSGAALTQSLSSSNPDRILSDLFLQTDGTGNIVLENMALLSLANGKNTFLSTTTTDADNLDNPQATPPVSTTYTSNTYIVPSSAVSTSKILYAKSTTDNKYVRILLMRNPSTGTLIYSTSPNRYIKVQISYQDTAGVIYSRFGSQ